ncbi:asparaginase [Gordonia aquimaris]|uniref:Asparaginase n=1 Tax=Gordonia aquimaris TaxID=2984863 RepID=A0A9X3I348_9ACTN|nr:asparaginase [Gordonia aquimaris]MCX2963208.1 asparaginase [Gordonia aquimaris]
MSGPRIAAASFGGTITMTSAAADGVGVNPALSAEQLMGAVPGLADVAELHTETLDTVPGASLTFESVLRGLAWARSQVARGADGVVLIQGTDTIEETAYLLDIYWDSAAPLVITGAMRSPELPGADGPANLMAAVRVASANRSRDRGVLVVLNDEVHAACRVRKARASGLGAFATADFGPIGYVDERQVYFGNRVDRPLPLELPGRHAPSRVALLETYLGDDGEVLDAIVECGFDGVVLAGFGVGHVSASCARAVQRATSIIPVVVTSRTGAGRTHDNSYAFPGSESDLANKGAILGGWLDARKARILLSCLIAGQHSEPSIRSEFAVRGHQVWSGRLSATV